jgi:hypothetical protein
VRIAAEKLRGDGMFVCVEMQVAFGLLILLAQHAVGRGELRHDEAAAAEITNEPAEDRVGDAGHGGEDGGRGNLDRAD